MLKVSCIGFEDAYLPKAYGNAGSIILHSAEVRVGEVVVSAKRPQTQIKGDALVTTITNSPLAHAGTANDVLGKVPGVIKSGESIEVLGKGTPLIYINGRLMRNSSELDQLASSSIKQVEVLTTPGAQYDASVNSVIRIKTARPTGAGFGFDSRSVVGVARYVYGVEELNFNYRNKGLDLFGMAEYENKRDFQAKELFQKTYAEKLLTQTTANSTYNRSPFYAGKIRMNYMCNERHSLGFFYDFSFRPTQTRDYSNTTLWVDKLLENELSTADTTKLNDRRHLLSGYYTGAWGK